MAWVFLLVASRIGIPRVDPSVVPTARPLETLGTVAVCLPASLHAALLGDHLPWLSQTSPRRRPLIRLAWLAAAVLPGAALALGWALTLPASVPWSSAVSVWLLGQAAAVWSVVLLRHDLALVLPLCLLGAASVPGLVPFGMNLVYNQALRTELMVSAALLAMSASVAYAALGDGEGRR